MKTITVLFEDKEYKVLTRLKGEKSWHDCILDHASSLLPPCARTLRFIGKIKRSEERT